MPSRSLPSFATIVARAVLLVVASRSVWAALLFLTVGGPLIYLR